MSKRRRGEFQVGKEQDDGVAPEDASNKAAAESFAEPLPDLAQEPEEFGTGRVELGVTRQRRIHMPICGRTQQGIELIGWAIEIGEAFESGVDLAYFTVSSSSKADEAIVAGYSGTLIERAEPGNYNTGDVIGLVELAEE